MLFFTRYRGSLCLDETIYLQVTQHTKGQATLKLSERVNHIYSRKHATNGLELKNVAFSSSQNAIADSFPRAELGEP